MVNVNVTVGIKYEFMAKITSLRIYGWGNFIVGILYIMDLLLI